MSNSYPIPAPPPLPETRHPPAGKAVPAVAATLVTLGVYLYCAFTYGNSWRESFLYVSTIGLPLMGIVFATAMCGTLVVRRLARRRFPRVVPAVVLPLSALAAVLLPVMGRYEALPETRFRWLLNGPPPASVRDLRIEMHNSFGDGHAWVLQFRIHPDDFATLQSRNRLHEFTNPEADRRRRAEPAGPVPADEIDLLYPEDRMMRVFMRDAYVRPPAPRFYRGGDDGRTLVVTDEARSGVARAHRPLPALGPENRRGR